ncbi:MAG: sugar ABC transporter permease [Alphaproteobacteria bacterium]|nr:sugar ABC transporter permease [Alphaproteobacteria bacterium]
MNRLRSVHYAMIAPAQVLLVAFILLPAVYVGWISLHRWSFADDPVFVGLGNYAAIFADRVFWRAVWNTFLVVNTVVYGELALGLGLAFLMAGWMPCKKLIIALLIAPYAITEVSAVVMWRTMFEPDIGMINWALMQIGLDQLEWSSDPNHALFLVALLSIWIHTPFTFLLLYAAVSTIPGEYVEAAHIDGATPWQTFWHIKLRMIMPALLIALMFRYITAMRVFGEVWLLTEGGPARLTEVLAVYLYRQAFRYHEFGTASATGLAMLVISLLIALPYLHQMHRRMFRHAGA